MDKRSYQQVGPSLDHSALSISLEDAHCSPIQPAPASQGAKVLVTLAVFGMFFSAFMVYQFYHPDQPSICDFGSHVSCTQLVHKGWASLFGVPVALLGLDWFFVLMVGQLVALHTGDPHYVLAVLIWAVMGGAMTFYFMAVELSLRVLCPVCTLVHIILVVVLALAVNEFRRHHGSPPLREVPRLVWRQLPQLLHTDALLLSVVLLLHLTPFLAFNATRALAQEEAEWDLDRKLALAQCLHKRHARMYGSTYCSHCHHQKALFGDAIQYVDFLDCEDTEVRPRCASAKLIGYPTWVRFDDADQEVDRHVGMMPLSHLSQWSGCPIPPEATLFTSTAPPTPSTSTQLSIPFRRWRRPLGVSQQ